MSDQVELMTLEMVDEISALIHYRQQHFGGEDLDTTVKVVLLNYGERRRVAHCISGDWSGPKADMNQTPSGLPICPKCGQVATEDEKGWRLALVKETAALDLTEDTG